MLTKPQDVKTSLRKILPDLLKAKQDQLNEADTVTRIILVLQNVLGYDIMTEITREQQIKDKYVDLAIKIDGHVRLLIEVKAANFTLRDRFIEQAERYASEGNYQWVLLTTGVLWNLYHLTFDEGINYDRAWTFDLENDNFDKCAELIALLHHKSITGNGLEDYWKHKQALDIPSLGTALFSEDVIELLRREIKKKTGLRPDPEDVANALNEMLTVEARQALGPPKIRKTRKPHPGKQVPATTGEPAEAHAGILTHLADTVQKVF